MQKTLDTIVSENQSVPTKYRTILHTLSSDIIDVLNKPNKNLSV